MLHVIGMGFVHRFVFVALDSRNLFVQCRGLASSDMCHPSN